MRCLVRRYQDCLVNILILREPQMKSPDSTSRIGASVETQHGSIPTAELSYSVMPQNIS